MSNLEIDLRLGDCLEILPTLADNSVDAVITDLPYGMTACSWDKVIPFAPMWKEIKRTTNTFITTASQPFTSKLVMSNLLWFKYSWVWDKTKVTGGINAKYMPMKAHEDILIFSNGDVHYFPQMTKWTPEQIKRKRKRDAKLKGNDRFIYRDCIAPGRDKQVKNGRHPDSVIRIKALGSHDPERAGHPTQKPVALIEYLIKTYTNKGDTVADICMGVGSTGVACVQTGRNFIGIEIEPKYFEIAEKRIAEAQLQMRMEI